MIQQILLIDNGVTVQKIVALSLDKARFNPLFAVSKEEAKQIIMEKRPNLLLVSDRLEGLEWQRFPKEVETWLGRGAVLPKMILITAEENREARHYQGVLRKPFTPQSLKEVIASQLSGEKRTVLGKTLNETQSPQERERLEGIYNDASLEEVTLPSATLNSLDNLEEPIMNLESNKNRANGSIAREKLESLWEDTSKPIAPIETTIRSESVSELWGTGVSASSGLSQDLSPKKETEILTTEDSLAYKSLLENQVQQQIETQNINEIVEKVLSRILPPMVERVIQERLDRLMQEQDQAIQSEL